MTAAGSPRIDVLLPVRAALPALAEAVHDVLVQEGVAVRVLAVVDRAADGRDDGSRDWLIDAARRERRLVVLDGPGREAGAALDVALAAVETDVFAQMEADDRCPPHRLATLAAALPATPGLAGVVSRAEAFGAPAPGIERYLAWQNALTTGAAMARERFIEIPALHQTGLYRTAAVRELGGYTPRGPWPPDIDFWLRWFERERAVVKVPAVLYRWRQHAGQSTRTSPRHTMAALRACKVAFLARLLGPRPVQLVATGETLARWECALADAGVALTAAIRWRPGEPAPRPAPGELLLAVYGMARARAALRAACPDLREPDDLLFAA